jgi:hypothetical protein
MGVSMSVGNQRLSRLEAEASHVSCESSIDAVFIYFYYQRRLHVDEARMLLNSRGGGIISNRLLKEGFFDPALNPIFPIAEYTRHSQRGQEHAYMYKATLGVTPIDRIPLYKKNRERDKSRTSKATGTQ